MYRNIEVLRLLPDRAGRGGTKLGYHSFQQQPINDTRVVHNVHIWQDSWRSDFLPTTVVQFYNYFDNLPAATGNKNALAVHGYSKFSLTDPTIGPTAEILGHNTRVVGAANTGYIWNYTTPVEQVFEPPFSYVDSNVVCTASVDQPAVFCNIGNRCFIARSSGEAVIYDSSHGSPVFSSAGTPRAYTLGVGAPKAAPVVTASDVVDNAEIYLRKDSIYISWPDPNGALSTATTSGGPGGEANAVNDTLFLEGDGVRWDTLGVGGDTVNIANKTDSFSTAGYTVTIVNGTDIATFTPAPPTGSAWVGLNLVVNGLEFVMLAFGNDVVLGDPSLTATQCQLSQVYDGGSFPDDPDSGPGGYDPAFDIVDATFSVVGVRWELYRNTANVDWLGGTSADTTIKGTLINTGGRLTWADTPPSYAYAWYDPETGHISNISPIFSPDATSKDEVGIQVKVDNGSISYPPTTTIVPSIGGWKRWTHILFFRTLMAGGSTLYPIGSLDPTSSDWRGLPDGNIKTIPPATTGNYWLDSGRDTELLISGALRAPQFTNNKPRVIQNGVEQIIYPSHMAYWDGRLWTAGSQDPAALHYSCDRVQCPFGIPEESFPDTNVLRIPAADGCVRGMKLIGENLLITTERWAYTVAGNNESNYRLIRISTRMAGVGNYQMTEFVPETEGQTALVVFLGTDSKIYAMPLGGEAVWISKEIQTALEEAQLSYRLNYNKCRVHAVVTNGRRLLVVYIYRLTTGGQTFIYDFDTKTWSSHTLRNTFGNAATGFKAAFGTTQDQLHYGTEIYTQIDAASLPATDSTIRLWNWLDSTVSTPIQSGYVRTFPLNFDGKKTRKQIHFVRIYTSNIGTSTGSGWECTLRINSASAGGTVSFGLENDDAYKQIPLGAVPVDSSTATELIVPGNVLQYAALGYDTPAVGYTFDLQVTFPSATDMIYRLYAVDIGWSTLSEEQQDI